MQNSFQLQFAKLENVPEIQRLLKSADLPYADIEGHIRNFLFVEDEHSLIACVGLEIHEDFGLLRSLAVDEKFRKQGLGTVLVNEILQFAAHLQIKKLYLLTTTAEVFFSKLGFMKIDRSDAPEAIRSTTEFTSLCPANAIFMCKEL